MHEAVIKERASLMQRIDATETENRELRVRLDSSSAVAYVKHEQDQDQDQNQNQNQEQEQIIGGSVGRRDMSIPSVTTRQDHGASRYNQKLRAVRSSMAPIPVEMRRASMQLEHSGEESSAGAAGLESLQDERGEGEQQEQVLDQGQEQEVAV